MTDPVADLLRATRGATPNALQAALRAAMRGPNGRAIERAMATDPRLGPMLVAIARDASARRKLPLVTRVLARLPYPPAVPVLLELVRTASYSVAQPIASHLLRSRDPAVLEALAATLPVTKAGLPAFGACEKLARAAGTGPATARLYERLAPMLALGPTARTNVFRQLHVLRDLIRAEPRFAEAALADALDPKSPARAYARIIVSRLPPAAQQSLLARRSPAAPPAAAPSDRDAALAPARARVTRLLAALPRTAVRAAPRRRAAELARLERMVGPLPAVLRAFYEACDGVTTAGVVIEPLGPALTAATRWHRRHGAQPARTRPLFELPIAPDGFERAGFSGGPPCVIELPTPDDDPRVRGLPRAPRLGTLLARAAKR